MQNEVYFTAQANKSKNVKQMMWSNPGKGQAISKHHELGHKSKNAKTRKQEL